MKNINSRNIYSLILTFFLFLSSTTIAQKKINKLINYTGKDYWVVKKDGLRGLNSGEKEKLVPANYDLALPSSDVNLSFIAKNGALGLYDILNRKELLLLGGFNRVSLFVDVDNKLVLKFYNPYNYDNKEVVYILKRDIDKQIILKKEEKYAYHKPIETHEENGLERVDSVHFIHHFSNLAIYPNEDKIEEEAMNVNLESSIQKTGVYSLAINDFIVPPEFISIVRLFEEDNYENIFYLDFYSAMQLDKASFDKTSKSYKPIREWNDLHRNGLYSKAFKLLVPPQRQRVSPLGNEWYYLPTNSDTLSIYDQNGSIALHLSDFTEPPSSLEFIGNKYCLATESDDQWYVNMEMNTKFYTYYIYNKDGTFLKTEKFNMGSATKNNNVFVVQVQAADDDWTFLYGIYNFEKSEFVLPPVYTSIERKYFREGIIDCKPGNCSCYFELEKRGSITYLDQNMNPFIPQHAINADVFEKLDSYDSNFKADLQITELDVDDPDYKSFLHKALPIAFKLTDYEFSTFEFEPLVLYGFVQSEYKNIEILTVYAYDSKEGDQPFFALRYKNDYRLLLPPFFSKMEFNKDKNTLEFTYQGASGSISLERYEK